MSTELERRIFGYTVAGQEFYADPLAVRRRLDHALGQPINEVLALVHGSDALQAFAADERVLEATRFAFEMPYDKMTGMGATEDEVRAALGAYHDFLSRSGRNGATTPPSWHSSGENDPQATAPGWDSSSMPNG